MNGESPARLPSAFDLLDGDRVRTAARRMVVFLDFDGTLSPIVARPADAALSDAARAAVRALAAVCPVAVVSGRELADLRDRVALPGVRLAGSHGLEFADNDGAEWRHPDADGYLDDLNAAEADMRGRVGAIDGIEIERKRFSVAVHYRRAADRAAAVDAAVAAVLADHPRLDDIPGKMVHDLRPALRWHKGECVGWVLRRLALTDSLPLYIGDDITDEDAFAAVAGAGIGIRVGEDAAATRAGWFLRDSGEVREFLERLQPLLAS